MNGKFMILNIFAIILTVSLTSESTTWKYESLQCQGTYSEYCFNWPDSTDDYRTFDDAVLWCQNRSSHLAVISDNETQEAASEFLDSWSHFPTNLVYINMKLRMATVWTWYLIDGSIFYGGVIDQGPEAYKLYDSLQFASTPPESSFGIGSRSADWWTFASRPDILQPYICEFNESICSTMNNSFLYNSRCYTKYENDLVNWFEARKQCISNGGDLATFYVQSSNVLQPPFDTASLNRSLSYWVGIRYNNLSWMSPADSKNESMFYNWSRGKPNNFDYSCVCLDPNGLPRWSWTDCNCSVPRPFLCLTKIQTTPTTTTTTTTATTTKQPTMSAGSNSDTKSLDNKLIIAIAVGVGGGIITIIVVIIVVVCIITRRKKRRAQSSEYEEKPTKELASNDEYLDAEAIQGFAADNPQKVPDVAHPKKENGTATQEWTGLYGEVSPGPADSQDSFEKEGHEETTYDGLQFVGKDEDQDKIVKSRTQTIYSPGESSAVYANYAG